MTISERQGIRLFGLVLLFVPVLSIVGMAIDGRIEWQLERDNPVGNTVALMAIGATGVCGLCLLLYPRVKESGWQRKILGATLLLFALKRLSGLLRNGFLNGPVNFGYILAIVLTLGLTAFFALLGIALLKGKKAEPANSLKV